MDNGICDTDCNIIDIISNLKSLDLVSTDQTYFSSLDDLFSEYLCCIEKYELTEDNRTKLFEIYTILTQIFFNAYAHFINTKNISANMRDYFIDYKQMLKENKKTIASFGKGSNNFDKIDRLWINNIFNGLIQKAKEYVLLYSEINGWVPQDQCDAFSVYDENSMNELNKMIFANDIILYKRYLDKFLRCVDSGEDINYDNATKYIMNELRRYNIDVEEADMDRNNIKRFINNHHELVKEKDYISKLYPDFAIFVRRPHTYSNTYLNDDEYLSMKRELAKKIITDKTVQQKFFNAVDDELRRSYGAGSYLYDDSHVILADMLRERGWEPVKDVYTSIEINNIINDERERLEGLLAKKSESPYSIFLFDDPEMDDEKNKLAERILFNNSDTKMFFKYIETHKEIYEKSYNYLEFILVDLNESTDMRSDPNAFKKFIIDNRCNWLLRFNDVGEYANFKENIQARNNVQQHVRWIISHSFALKQYVECIRQNNDIITKKPLYKKNLITVLQSLGIMIQNNIDIEHLIEILDFYYQYLYHLETDDDITENIYLCGIIKQVFTEENLEPLISIYTSGITIIPKFLHNYVMCCGEDEDFYRKTINYVMERLYLLRFINEIPDTSDMEKCAEILDNVFIYHLLYTLVTVENKDDRISNIKNIANDPEKMKKYAIIIRDHDPDNKLLHASRKVMEYELNVDEEDPLNIRVPNSYDELPDGEIIPMASKPALSNDEFIDLVNNYANKLGSTPVNKSADELTNKPMSKSADKHDNSSYPTNISSVKGTSSLLSILIAYDLSQTNEYDLKMEDYLMSRKISQDVILSIKLAKRKNAIVEILRSVGIGEIEIIKQIVLFKRKSAQLNYDRSYNNLFKQKY